MGKQSMGEASAWQTACAVTLSFLGSVSTLPLLPTPVNQETQQAAQVLTSLTWSL